MKLTPEIIAALQTLKNAAENDFELHRINTLERDLTTPPKVEIIDDTHQMFDGITYKQDKSGHYYKMIFIHTSIWNYYNGIVPEGDYVIHHKNFNPSDNVIENLELMTRAAHTKIHLENVQFIKICPICNNPFRTTTVGVIYCSEKCREKAQTFINKCQFCGKEFEVSVKHHTVKKFCSQECMLKARQDNLLSSRLGKKEICRNCGKEYPASERVKGGFCSGWCRNKYTVSQNLEERSCAYCGTKFKTYKYSAKKFCSRRCANKNRAENIHHSKSVAK